MTSHAGSAGGRDVGRSGAPTSTTGRPRRRPAAHRRGSRQVRGRRPWRRPRSAAWQERAGSGDFDGDAVAVTRTTGTPCAAAWRCRNAGTGCAQERSSFQAPARGCGSSTSTSSSWERPHGTPGAAQRACTGYRRSGAGARRRRHSRRLSSADHGDRRRRRVAFAGPVLRSTPQFGQSRRSRPCTAARRGASSSTYSRTMGAKSIWSPEISNASSWCRVGCCNARRPRHGASPRSVRQRRHGPCHGTCDRASTTTPSSSDVARST